MLYSVNKRTIRYSIVGCLATLVASILYAIIKLYILGQRSDPSILFVNVILFTVIAGILIYLTKKERDTDEEELFKD